MSTIREVKAKDWNELNDHLFADTYSKRINRYRSSFAYRGVAEADFPLSNSLARLGPGYDNMERNLLKQFKKYAHRDVVERETDWHWLSVAQHHGLPTRLLDWTYSPYIALHFATANLDSHEGKDAAVWKVNYSHVHDLLQEKHTEKLREFGAKIFSVDALANTIAGIDELDKARTYAIMEMEGVRSCWTM